MAREFPVNVKLLKYLRIGVLVVIGLIGINGFRWPEQGQSAFRLLVFGLVFAAAAVWSDSVQRGLMYKGLFVCACVAGIAMANRLMAVRDVNYLLRTLSTCGWVLLGLVFAAQFTGYSTIFKGRLLVFGINPNALSQVCAVLTLISLFRLLVDRRARQSCFLCSIGLMYVILLSGSRGAILMVVGGVGLGWLCHYLRRERTLIRTGLAVLLLVVTVVVTLLTTGTLGPTNKEYLASWQGRQAEDFDGVLRIQSEMFKNTRAGIWQSAGRKIAEKPLLGWGWYNKNGYWTLLQSAYLQVIVELGALGGLLIIYFLSKAFRVVVLSLEFRRYSDPSLAAYGIFFGVMATAMLLHGALESGMIVGTAPNPVILAFALTQLDRMLKFGIIRPR